MVVHDKMSKIINPKCPICKKRESDPKVGMCWKCHGRKMEQLEHERKLSIEPDKPIKIKTDNSPFKEQCCIVGCDKEAKVKYDKLKYCSLHLVQHSYMARNFIRELLNIDFGNGITSRQIASRINKPIESVSSKLTILAQADLIKRKKLKNGNGRGNWKQYQYMGLCLTPEIDEILKLDERFGYNFKTKTGENPHRPWEKYELEYLKNNWFKKTDYELGQILGRSFDGVKKKRTQMGYIKGTRKGPYESLKNTIANQETKIKEMEDRNKLLVSENNELRGKKGGYNDINKKMEGLIGKNKMLYNQIEEYRMECDNLKRENKQLKNNRKNMLKQQGTGAIGELKDELKNKDILINAQLTNIKELEYEIYETNMIKEIFNKNNKELKQENDQLQHEYKILDEKNKELKQQLKNGNTVDCERKIAKLKKELFNLIG